MYDPVVGRFLQEDPKGFAAGDENLYGYVGNSPTNATDPSGQWLLIDKDQTPYWDAIAEVTGLKIGTTEYPNNFIRGGLDWLVLNAPPTQKARDSIADILRMSGLSESDIKWSLNALYEGDLSGNDPPRTGRNAKITFDPPEVVEVHSWFNSDAELDKAVEAWTRGGDKIGDGVWVLPGGTKSGYPIEQPRPSATGLNVVIKSDSSGRPVAATYNAPTYFLIRPDPNVRELVLVRGPRASISVEEANWKFETTPKGDCPPPKNAIGSRPSDAEIAAGRGGLVTSAGVALDVYLGIGLAKAGYHGLRYLFGWGAGTSGKAAAASELKAEVAKAAKLRAAPTAGKPVAVEMMAKPGAVPSAGQRLGQLIAQSGGKLPETSQVYKDVVAVAERFGHRGPVVVIRGSGPADRGAALFDGKVLVVYEDKFVKGFSRFGNTLSGEAQVAHEIAHTSRRLDPKIQAGKGFSSDDPMNWAKESAVSLEASEFRNLSSAARRELFEDAKRNLIYAEHLTAFRSALANGNAIEAKRLLDAMRAMK
jgi:hypothetical protein